MLHYQTGRMLLSAIGIGILLLMLVCTAMFSRQYSRSRKILSTSEWVKLMRENDIRADAKSRNKAAKRRRPQ
jgi:hypothetical protein